MHQRSLRIRGARSLRKSLFTTATNGLRPLLVERHILILWIGNVTGPTISADIVNVRICPAIVCSDRV